MVIHDTKYAYWDQVSLNKSKTLDWPVPGGQCHSHLNELSTWILHDAAAGRPAHELHMLL